MSFLKSKKFEIFLKKIDFFTINLMKDPLTEYTLNPNLFFEVLQGGDEMLISYTAHRRG